MNDNKEVAIKKYTAIAKANRSMFITVSIASVIVSASIVLSVFLMQKILFKTKVIGVQSKTLKDIEDSSKNIENLKNKVKGLQSNETLLSSRSNAEDNALRVVLDALPAEGNSEAIGSSLSAKILNVSGLTIESLRVEPINDSQSVNMANTSTADATPSSITTSQGAQSSISPKVKTANFSFSVMANGEGASAGEYSSGRTPYVILMELLQNMEKSIRTFKISDFKIEMNKGGSMNLVVNGQAYYLPEYSLQLTKQTIQSSQNNKSNTSSTKSGGSK